jgi:hypothetical protein
MTGLLNGRFCASSNVDDSVLILSPSPSPYLSRQGRGKVLSLRGSFLSSLSPPRENQLFSLPFGGEIK